MHAHAQQELLFPPADPPAQGRTVEEVAAAGYAELRRRASRSLPLNASHGPLLVTASVRPGTPAERTAHKVAVWHPRRCSPVATIDAPRPGLVCFVCFLRPLQW